VPHLILAIAAVFASLFLLRGVVSLYGSLAILVIVYTISRISFATRIINNSLAQIHPELEEAAFVGGLPLWQVMRKILLPLLRPALVYAWLWMALLCFRELTMASVLVTSQGNVTLPMIVWGLWLGGSLNQAAAANLVVLSFMLPAVIVYLYYGRRSRFAANSTSRCSGYCQPFVPNPPPTSPAMTRMRLSGTLKMRVASACRTRCGYCTSA